MALFLAMILLSFQNKDLVASQMVENGYLSCLPTSQEWTQCVGCHTGRSTMPGECPERRNVAQGYAAHLMSV